MNKDLPSKWDVTEDTLHSDCRIFQVHKRCFRRQSDGVEGECFVLDTNDWVNVLAVSKRPAFVGKSSAL